MGFANVPSKRKRRMRHARRNPPTETTWILPQYWTGKEIDAFAVEMFNAFKTLLDDYTEHKAKFSKSQLSAFQAFYNDWITWQKIYYETWHMRYSGRSVDTMIEWGRKLEYWRQLFQDVTGKAATGTPLVMPPKSKVDDIIKLTQIGLVVAGIIAFGYVMNKVT
jgi:hypothetical protein